MRPMHHALHLGIPRPGSGLARKRVVDRHRKHYAGLGSHLPADGRYRLLLTRQRAVDPPTADQNRRLGPGALVRSRPTHGKR